MTQENLMKKLCQKDERAFNLIMNQYSKLLWKTADDILKNVSSIEDVEECIADVFFKLWQNPQAFNPQRSNLKNYLVMVTRSHALDIYRKKTRHPELELDENIPYSEYDMLHHLIQQENKSQLYKALDSLPVCDKEIMTRRYLQDEKPAEISRQMNLPIRNVENRIYRTKQKLRQILCKFHW